MKGYAPPYKVVTGWDIPGRSLLFERCLSRIEKALHEALLLFAPVWVLYIHAGKFDDALRESQA